jgi:GNAT superfamily N-acetyltransferase
MAGPEQTSATGEEVELRDGSTIVIRPLEPSDSELLADQFDRLSDESRRRRYLAPAARLSPEDLAALTAVDHKRHDALMALDPDGRAIGIARYVRTQGDPTTAEAAVEVVDEWHRRGVASALLRRLHERARANGIEHYSAVVSDDNKVMLEGLERAGARRMPSDQPGELEFSVDVPSEGVGEGIILPALRAAASGQLSLASSVVRKLLVWRR